MSKIKSRLFRKSGQTQNELSGAEFRTHKVPGFIGGAKEIILKHHATVVPAHMRVIYLMPQFLAFSLSSITLKDW